MTSVIDLPITLLLDIERIKSKQAIDCKKRAIEEISELLASDFKGADKDINGISDNNQKMLAIFKALMQRERISATTIGNGIAMPHACLPFINAIKIALITLEESISFESPDDASVGIIVGFLFPESDGTQDKQSFLKVVAEAINHPKIAGALRQAENPREILAILDNIDLKN